MLLLRKGVYPYEYMDDWDRFNEEKLPNKSGFYSSLNMEDISEIDYKHAAKVFNEFNIKILGEYHDLYFQSDTSLLADVFESFRNLFIKTFLSLPGLAWQAYLKRAGVKLELISDIDMLLMIEEGIKGGICHSVLRHAKANNKYMKGYNENKDDSFLIYTDYNNLYGKAISEKLPVDGFERIEDTSEIDENFIENYDENKDVGYLIKADSEYPKELHNKHSYLPFLPERMKVNKCKKLVCNLYGKKDYVDHIRLLKQALNHGLKIKKIHKILKFNQRAWLKEYIDMNTELRMNAENDFNKDFYKLMNNTVYGKTMENVRKHKIIKLVNDDTKRNKLVSEPNYYTTKLFPENLLAIEMKKSINKDE